MFIKIKRNIVSGFNSKLLSWLTRKKHVLCLGDSHIKVFKYIEEYKLLLKVKFDILCVEGATSQGMVNPNSKTNALKIFRERIDVAKSWQNLIFNLGEVDCGFVIWYRADKYGVSVDEQLEYSLKNYLDFLDEVRNRGFKNIYVLSVPLPTIADRQSWGEIANFRKEIKASQRERTKLTFRYNEMLRQRCQIKGLYFVDVTSEQLEADTGLIAPQFLNKDPLDHHLNEEKYAQLIIKQMKDVLN